MEPIQDDRQEEAPPVPEEGGEQFTSSIQDDHRKVYVVSHFIPFEGGDVKAVFSTAEKADAYAKEATVRNAEDWTGVDVSDEEFLVAEMEVS